MKHFLPFLILFFSFAGIIISQDDQVTQEEIDEYNRLADSIDDTFVFTYGLVELLDGDATLNVPSGFKFLDKEQSEFVLTTLWGNPPSPVEGMLFPEDMTPMTMDFTYAVEISYSDEGFIKDDDAKELDYEELLEEMQADTEETNEYRRENDYPTVELVRWASQPFYDAESKKLHWAKELKFEDSEINTLNYNIRILGRKGYLNLNAIGDIGILGAFKGDVDNILNAVEFNPGNSYFDFDPDVDKIAAYGIGGLIAGKILMKAGLLAKLGILLAKFWKIILIAAIAIGAGLKKFLGMRNKKDELAVETDVPGESDTGEKA